MGALSKKGRKVFNFEGLKLFVNTLLEDQKRPQKSAFGRHEYPDAIYEKWLFV